MHWVKSKGETMKYLELNYNERTAFKKNSWNASNAKLRGKFMLKQIC